MERPTRRAPWWRDLLITMAVLIVWYFTAEWWGWDVALRIGLALIVGVAALFVLLVVLERVTRPANDGVLRRRQDRWRRLMARLGR